MIAVGINDVWKKYQVDYKRRMSIKELLLNLGRKKTDFCALQGVSIEIKKGEALGIIGSNGSGKTTLLRIILGITQPTRGKIKINGRTAGLLELGTGFHQDLTGRENIYLNGSVLGLKKKEINRLIDPIIDFAAIGDFINAPVRTYSAGMYLRLGFAIASHVEPEILLIDEILGTGDEQFFKKSFQRILRFKQQKKTIIIASHDLNSLNILCSTLLLLKNGKIRKQGMPDEVIRYYQETSGDSDKK